MAISCCFVECATAHTSPPPLWGRGRRRLSSSTVVAAGEGVFSLPSPGSASVPPRRTCTNPAAPNPATTARAENFIYGRTDLDDTIRRLQAFEAAGADVLYAPAIRDLATIKTVVSALRKPFNLVMGLADPTLTVAQLTAAGVKRISVGGAMSRVALAAFLRCAREMKDKGSFTFAREMVPIKDLWDVFAST